jgi:chromate transporter
VFRVALRLGLTSFGGPVAHVSMFRDEYVRRRGWLEDGAFAELVAVTSLLPGPSSSQLGMAIGGLRAGVRGALAGWIGFTLPSAVVMTALGLGLAGSDVLDGGVVHGLELVTVAVVLLAVIGMRRTLAPDATRLAVALVALVCALGLGGARGQLVALLVGAVAGGLLFRGRGLPPVLDLALPIARRAAIACLVVFGGLLLALPAASRATGVHAVELVDAFYRSGALVFGGGHVVLPLLESEVVDPGWVSEEAFLAGYGAAQALPGPLFTFSAYLGAIAEPEPNGLAGAALALGAIFLPAMLVLGGALPLWAAIRRHPTAYAVTSGIGAAVVGILAAALWDPVISTALEDVGDVLLAAALFAALRVVPVWGVVALGAALGALLL